jgi:hypothetical protein
LEKGPFPCYWVQWEWLLTSIDGVSRVVGAVKEQRIRGQGTEGTEGTRDSEEQGVNESPELPFWN